MRSDIQKAICERMRYRDRWSNGGGKGRRVGKIKHSRGPKMDRRLSLVVDDETGEVDDLSPTMRPMSIHGKGLTDFLTPLEGWLAKQIGRPYDDVYSELCAHLGGNGVLQRHVKGHAEDYLTPPERVRIINGIPCEADTRFNGYRGYENTHGHPPIECNELYGDPRDGIVKWGPTKPKYRASSGLGRYNPKAQQRSYRKLPRRDGARIELGAEVLFRDGGKWYHVRVRTTEAWDYDLTRPREVTTVELATPRTLKRLGFRPEKKRR